MAPPSLLYEALATLVFNFALTGVNAAAALLKPHLPGAAELDDIALVFALVMVRGCARGARGCAARPARARLQQQPLRRGAEQRRESGAQGFLTLFAFLLAGAYINPAATAIEFLAGNIKPRRFAALRACPCGGGSCFVLNAPRPGARPPPGAPSRRVSAPAAPCRAPPRARCWRGRTRAG